jgi:hypothetical protein
LPIWQGISFSGVYLKHKVYARNPKNKQELRPFIVEEFNTIPQNIIENPYLSVIQ